MSARNQLRKLLSADGMLIAPGAYDGITARMIEQAGFQVIYMTGAGTAATLGYPDYGLVTMSEMADNAGRIVASAGVPVIADADTGYGNEINVIRTVREYEKRGVAGLHIEDQGFPKKCGHLDRKQVITLEEYLAKIRAALAARQDPGFLIIARTDARAVLGFEEAIRRANAALQAGADMAFVEAPETLEEVAAVPKLVKGPCLLNLVWRGKTPEVGFDDAEGMGYKLAILPALLFTAVIGVSDRMLEQVRFSRRHPVPVADITVEETFARLGASEWDNLREQFSKAALASPATDLSGR
jgi:2-methylisocitrate lyase-like PEP mutase family enzyme